MKSRQVILTEDGSTSLYIPEWNEHYHSTHGAIQEAYHVYIQMGLNYFDKKEYNILEIGLGTGLNCFITFLESKKREIYIHYTGVEAYPVTDKEVKKLNFVTLLKAKKYQAVFENIHQSKWNEDIVLSANFTLTKRLVKFQDITIVRKYDIIYFDAFAPNIQPELWTENMFKIMYNALTLSGVLVTYSAKGSVRRAMQSAGFQVERLVGPPGKREMLRAVKN